MLSTFLDKLISIVIRYPYRVIVGSILPCLFFSAFLLHTPLDFSFLALMPTQDPVIKKFEIVGEELAINSQIILLLEGDSEEELDQTVLKLTDTLQKHPDVSYAISTPPQKWFEDNIAWVSNDDDFQDLLRLGDMITNQQKLKEIQNRYKELETVQEGFRLMWVGLHQDPLDVDVNDILANNAPFDRIEKTTMDVLESTSIEGGYAGMAAIAAQDQRKTIMAISKLTPLSLILVLILLRLVEPRIIRLVTLAVPMILSFVTTLGLTGLILGEINFVEAFFGMMIFGLGVDFGLHLLVRMREEYQNETSFEEALRKTILGVGPAIIAGAITTTGAFLLIGLAEDPTARHLGVSAGIGLLTCLILMFTLLPALWIVLVQKEEKIEKLSEFQVPIIPQLAKSAVDHPKKWIFGFVCAVCISMLGISNFHFEYNLEKLFNRDVPATSVGDRIYEKIDSNTTPWIFLSDSIEDARQINKKLKEEEIFTQSMGVADLFPTPFDIRHKKLLEAKDSLWVQRQKLQAFSIGPAYLSVPARRALPIILSLEQAIEKGPPTIDDLPIELKQQLISKSGKWVTYAYGGADDLNAKKFRKERLAAEAIQPEAAGIGNFVELAMDFNRPWIVPTTFGVLCFVALVLTIDLRAFRWIILALAPVVCSVLIAFGVMCWMNIGFSILLVLVVPLLLGLGVDDGLHVVHRMREDPSLPPDVATTSVSRAIVMTTLTTCTSFGVLIFANHPGMESMAIALLCGLPLCLLCSVTLIPALSVVIFSKD
jgi:uncharacterized protein